MPERVEPMPGVEVTWDPNAPEAVLLSDDMWRGALALRAHPSDSDQRAVVLRFDLASYALMTPPNDEALLHHRLYDRGLKDLSWLGVVRDSRLVESLKPMWHPRASLPEPFHFVAPLKECVVEVVAADVDVFRVEGSPRSAAPSVLSPESTDRA